MVKFISSVEQDILTVSELCLLYTKNKLPYYLAKIALNNHACLVSDNRHMWDYHK